MPSMHRVVSELARVPVSGTLLVATDDFADRRIDIDHQADGRGDTRHRGALERFAVHSFESADVTERERPQERPRSSMVPSPDDRAHSRSSRRELPKWVTKPDVWERAIEIFHGPVLDEDRAFIHRNFHPGNVLWHRRIVTGLVDLESASARWTSAKASIGGQTSQRSSGCSTPSAAPHQQVARNSTEDIEAMLQGAVNKIDGA